MSKSFCNKKKVFNKIKKLNVRSGEKMYHIKDEEFLRGKVPMTFALTSVAELAL